MPTWINKGWNSIPFFLIWKTIIKKYTKFQPPNEKKKRGEKPQHTKHNTDKNCTGFGDMKSTGNQAPGKPIKSHTNTALHSYNTIQKERTPYTNIGGKENKGYSHRNLYGWVKGGGVRGRTTYIPSSLLPARQNGRQGQIIFLFPATSSPTKKYDG